MNPLLAEIAVRVNGGLGHDIFVIFICVLIGLILWSFGRWVFPKFNAPPIVLTFWDGLFLLIAVIVVINFLAGLAGHRFIEW